MHDFRQRAREDTDSHNNRESPKAPFEPFLRPAIFEPATLPAKPGIVTSPGLGESSCGCCLRTSRYL